MTYGIPKDQDNVSEDMVFEFLEMSQRLLSLIRHENSILEECGILSMENYLAHRDALLKLYEQKAFLLLSQLDDGVTPKEMHKLMLEEISSLQKALNDNTTRKFRSLENTLSSYEGDASWH
ncbi:MAG TPA: hypothetical protein PKH37_02600 [Alphaproteobacteria bacterium]|nr:hypothetical protein [Alphaproteobacteria bacterium]